MIYRKDDFLHTEKAILYLSLENYTSKPKGKEVGLIQNSILHNKVEVTPKDLAVAVSEQGKAAKLCNLPEHARNLKSTPILSQQVLMLDIDNENTETELFTIEQALQDEYIKENACFIYETFSSTLERPKFRVVFFLETPLTHNQDVENSYAYLIKKYPQSDSKCRETTRLFFGSTKGYIPINWNNRLKIDKEKSSPETNQVRRAKKNSHKSYSFDKSSIPDNSEFVYNLLYTKQVEKVNSLVQNKNLVYYGAEFRTLEDFKQYLISNDEVSMVDLLDLPKTSPFRDIFHDETDPSAGIFRTKDSNVELYNCFSESNAFTGDILKVVGRLVGGSDYESLLLLKDCLGIKITEDKDMKQVEETKKSTERFISYIVKNTLYKKYPNTYKVIRNYVELVRFILEEFLESDVLYNTKSNKYELSSAISISSIQKRLFKGNFGYRVSRDKLHTVITTMSLLGMLSKKVDTEIPNYLLDQLRTYQSINKQAYRTEIYTLNNLTYYKLGVMDELAYDLLKENVSVSKLDYDYLFNTLGKKTADKTFISNTSEERMISNKSQLIENTAVKIILNRLKTNDFIEEKYLIRRIQQSLRKQNINLTIKEVTNSISKCRPSICNNYGLSRIALTKDNKLKYNIQDFPSNKRPNIYIFDEE